MTDVEYILKCIGGGVKVDLIKIVDESDISDEKKKELKTQIRAIRSCRGKPLEIEDVESISSLSEVLDGTVYIMSQDKCPSCKSLKERLKDSSGAEFIDLHSVEGERIAKKLDIKTVPSAYTYKNGEPVACEIFTDGENVLVTCDGETIELV